MKTLLMLLSLTLLGSFAALAGNNSSSLPKNSEVLEARVRVVPLPPPADQNQKQQDSTNPNQKSSTPKQDGSDSSKQHLTLFDIGASC